MVYSALKQVAAAVTLIGAFGVASAATYDLGPLTTTIGVSGIAISGGSFDDIFSFTTTSANPVLGTFVGISGVDDMTVSYRFGVGATTPRWGAFTAPVAVTLDDASFAYSQTVSGLQAGTQYWFNLKGTGSEAVYAVTLAPVPEPETYAMLLAGLGLVGAIARRRKTTTTKLGA